LAASNCWVTAGMDIERSSNKPIYSDRSLMPFR
jgi:hypothetical protein